LFGYNRDETQKVLEEVADSFEEVWRERGELADKVDELEQKLDQYMQREELLSATLLAAERSATDAKDSARREADLIIGEAHQEARFLTRGAHRERERLIGETRRIEALLRSALELVGDSLSEVIPPAVSQPEQWADDEDDAPAQSWPATAPEPEVATSWRDRMDTAEYANLIPPPPPEPELELPEEPEPQPVDHDASVELPPVDPETGEDAGPARGFDWG
jgi:F0F1-type ATP synthase membrane subunit b/b'